MNRFKDRQIMIDRRRLLTLTAAGRVGRRARRPRARVAPSPRTRSAGSRRAAPSRCSTTIPTGSPRSSAISATSRRRSSPARRTRPRPSSSSTRTRPTSAIRRRACSRSAWRKGIPLVSVFEMGGADVFDFAFRKGEAPADIKGLEGKTIVLGSAGWQSIADPMLKAAGVDITKVKYVDAGWPTWGTAVMAGPGRHGAVVGRPARPVEGPGPRLRLHPRPQLLQAAGEQLRHPQGGFRGRGEARRSTRTISRAGRPASNSAARTRAPRRRSSWSSSPALPRR